MNEKNGSSSIAKSYIGILEKAFKEARELGAEDKEPVKKEIDIEDFADKDIILKTVLIGDGAVGKTSIRNSYMGEKFQPTYMATIGADFAVKDVNIYVEKIVRFQIWDLAGQQRFDVIRDTYYLGAHVAMIVFDHTRPDSFMNMTKWLNELWMNCGTGPVPFVILGNKTDLIPQLENKDLNLDARSFATSISKATEERYGFSIDYFPTSAKTGENIDEAFIKLAKNFLIWKSIK